MPMHPPTRRYWHDKGFVTIILSRVLNICALAFTIAFSGFLLLAVNWGALHAECIVKDTCDITAAALYAHPLQAQGIVWGALSLTYLAIFTLYWLWTVVHFVADLRDLLELKHFVNNKLGISERQVKMMTWSELVHRIVLLQRTTRCAPAPADTCSSHLPARRRQGHCQHATRTNCALALSHTRASPHPSLTPPSSLPLPCHLSL